MRVSKTVLGAAAALGLMVGAAHAASPDFSGVWFLDSARSESAGQAQPITNVKIIITQTPTLLSVERRDGEASRTVLYKMDGSDTKSTFGSDGAVGHVRRDGAKLITETVYNFHGFPMSQTQVSTLSDDGRQLTVESTVKAEHGYEGKSPDALTNPDNYSAGTDIYLRQASGRRAER